MSNKKNRKLSVFAAFLACGVIAAGLAAGCGSAKTSVKPATASQTSTSSSQTVTGGWTLQDSTKASLTADDQAVFDKAMEQYDGLAQKPVALLGTQVVSGTNYCFLTQGTTKDDQGFRIAIVYQDTQGNVELKKVTDLDITSDSFGTADEQTAGGWQIAEDTCAKPSEEDQAVLEKAVGDTVGCGYELVATLGTQVVSGTNYTMLCKLTPVVQNPVSHYSIVHVYQDLNGNVEITDTYDLGLSAFNE